MPEPPFRVAHAANPAGFNGLEIDGETVRITHYVAHEARAAFTAGDSWLLPRVTA